MLYKEREYMDESGRKSGMTQKERAFLFARKRFGTSPDRPFRLAPAWLALRHESSGKWYALFMEVDPNVLGLSGEVLVSIVNVRVSDGVLHSVLLRQKGIYPAYHMNKANWLTVILNDTVSDDTVNSLIEDSFFATADPKEYRKYRPPRAFIVPARVNLADPKHFFQGTDEIIWTQSSPSFKTGDIVCIYAGVPISCILYECRILETDLTPDADMEEEFPGKNVMRMRLIRRFNHGEYPKSILVEKYGITNIRGPRYLPDSLMEEMNRMTNK